MISAVIEMVAKTISMIRLLNMAKKSFIPTLSFIKFTAFLNSFDRMMNNST